MEAGGWERSSPWALGRSLWSECVDRGLVSKRLRPRKQGRDPKSGRPQGPVQKQASSRLTCRQKWAGNQAVRHQEKEVSALGRCLAPHNSNNNIKQKQNTALSTAVITTVTGFPGKATLLPGRENEIRSGKHVILTRGTKVRHKSNL